MLVREKSVRVLSGVPETDCDSPAEADSVGVREKSVRVRSGVPETESEVEAVALASDVEDCDCDWSDVTEELAL